MGSGVLREMTMAATSANVRLIGRTFEESGAKGHSNELVQRKIAQALVSVIRQALAE